MLGEKPSHVVGFENHGGRTYLNDVQPLGKVIKGYGNNGEDSTAGAFLSKCDRDLFSWTFTS